MRKRQPHTEPENSSSGSIKSMCQGPQVHTGMFQQQAMGPDGEEAGWFWVMIYTVAGIRCILPEGGKGYAIDFGVF